MCGAFSGVPHGRVAHSAVWTGHEMVVWGGFTARGQVATGGRYHPAFDPIHLYLKT